MTCYMKYQVRWNFEHLILVPKVITNFSTQMCVSARWYGNTHTHPHIPCDRHFSKLLWNAPVQLIREDMLPSLLVCLTLAHGMRSGARMKLSLQENLIPFPWITQCQLVQQIWDLWENLYNLKECNAKQRIGAFICRFILPKK